MIKNIFLKINIIISMRKFSFKYIDWRIKTAYPDGWMFVFKNPFIFMKDINKYLNWYLELDQWENANKD